MINTYFRHAGQNFVITCSWCSDGVDMLSVRSYANRRFSEPKEIRKDQLPTPLQEITMNLPDNAWLHPIYNKNINQHK